MAIRDSRIASGRWRYSAGRSEHHSGKQIRYRRRKALLASPAFIAPSRDFGMAWQASRWAAISVTRMVLAAVWPATQAWQVDVLGTQHEEGVE